MQSSKTYIYSLIDPRTNTIRYIGKSNNPTKRLWEHCNTDKKNPYKIRWVKKLTRLGTKPVIKIIEEVNQNEWREKEVYWINYYRELGLKLINSTDGGDGAEGYKHTDEAKKKISIATTIRNKKPENIERMKLLGKKRTGAILTTEHKEAISSKKKFNYSQMSIEEKEQLNKNKIGTKRLGAKSQYKGVSWNKQSNSWRVVCYINKKRITLGHRKIETQAALLYNQEAPKYLNNFFKPNKINYDNRI